MPKHYKAHKIAGVKYDEHRLIAEDRLGRKLGTGEVVLHIDGDKLNNDPANLQVMTRAEHSRLHMAGRTLSEETRARLSEARMGKPNTACRKLTRDQVFAVLEFRAALGLSERKIARQLGVGRDSVRGILRRERHQDWVREWEGAHHAP